jgi:hypothetical protein
MKRRVLLYFLAGILAVLAIVNLTSAIHGLQAARAVAQILQNGNTGANVIHDIEVRDVFGFPWWVMPAGLGIAAVVSFGLARRAR